MQLEAIEIVEDRTRASRCDEGFLKLSRLRLRNVYDDGSRSDVYACDVVSRPGSDAVVAVLYELDGERRVRVLLRASARPPIYLRRHKRFVHPDPREYRSIEEVVAGMVEEDDGEAEAGLRRRAAVEAEEEAGCCVPESAFQVIGGETFASPGMSDEKVYYCAAEAPLATASHGRGDGSVMEEHGQIVIRELGDAIRACRRGDVPDMKTEIALLRLADRIGYLPQLDCFVDELPEELRTRYAPLGVEPAPGVTDETGATDVDRA
jgi:ADP-ribose pyrophosphatase